MKRIIRVWIFSVVSGLLIAGALLLYKTAHTEGSILWLTRKSSDSSYHPIVLTVPEPKLPSPNGYDTLVKAGAALTDIEGINAAFQEGPDVSSDTVRKLIAENATALTLFKIGLTQPYLHPIVRSFDTKSPYLVQWRRLARLLALDAHTRATRGDWSGATQHSLDIIQFGAAIPHGSADIVSLVGASIQNIGYRELWPCVKHLTASQAREAMRRLSHISNTRESCANILQNEMYWTYASAKAEEIDHNPDFRERRAEEILLGLYVKDMQQTIANVRLPYALQPPSPPLHGGWSEGLAPDARQVATKMTGNQVTEELLLIALALRAYADKHTHYPTALNELAPAYLPQIPEDPFALHSPYRYKRQGATYLLYSIGPDGRDNGGKPFTNPPAEGGKSGSKRITADSKGDIVAPRE